MSRNVVRSLRRPRARAQWLSPTTPCHARRWYSELEAEEAGPSKSIIDNREESIHLLRTLDQKQLSETRKDTEGVVPIVEKFEEEVRALPITIRTLPEIPPYTLGFARHITQESIPDIVKRTKDSAEHVRAHLIDLQYKPYKDHDENPLAMFERQMAALSEDEKREKHNELKNQIAAKLVRKKRSIEEAKKTITETIARHKTMRGAPMPEFTREKTSTDDEAEGHAFKDLAEPIVTEGKRSESWGKVSKPLLGTQEHTGWKDAEPRSDVRIQYIRTKGKESNDEVKDDQEASSKVSATQAKGKEVKDGQGASSSASPARAKGKKEAKADGEAREFEDLKADLESTTSKKKK